MGDNLPGVHNNQMSVKAKLRVVYSQVISLASTHTHITSAGSFVLCEPERNVAIYSCKLVYVVAPTGGAKVTDFKVGIGSDDDAICSAQNTDDDATAGGNAPFELVMNNTLRKGTANPNQHRGLPVLPAGESMFSSATPVANAGSVRLVVSYLPLDD